MAEINASQYFINPRNGMNPKSYIGVEYGLYKYHFDKDQINNHINKIHNTHLKLDGIHGLTVFGDSLSDIRKGAKNIVVVGTPDMSSTPAAARRSHQRQTELAVLTDTHNARTKLMIEKLNSRNKNSDIRIHYFDIGEKMKVIINEANQISDYNTKESFYKKWYIKLFKNKKMVINHKYIFNDKVHPSQEVQFILAYEMEKFIKSTFA